MSLYMFFEELAGAIGQIERTLHYADEPGIPPEVALALARIGFELKGIDLAVEEMEEAREEE